MSPSSSLQRTAALVLALALVASILMFGGGRSAHAATVGTTEMVSRTSSGAQPTAPSFVPSTSGDGRWVTFSTAAPISPNDTNGARDTYLRDRQSGTTARVSLTHTGGQQSDGSGDPADVSDDGRFVAFASSGTNLVAGADGNGAQQDIFVRDRVAATTTRVSNTSTGTQPAGGAYEPRLSADGRYVVFLAASALVPADADGYYDVYRFDRQTSSLELVTVDEADGQIAGWTYRPDVSADGNRVVFSADGSGIAGGDVAGRDVFVRDIDAGTTTLVSKTSDGTPVVGSPDGSDDPAISADGRWVVFESRAALVADDTNGKIDVYRHDLDVGTTERMSVTDTEGQVTSHDIVDADVSGDGNLVAFSSAASMRTGDTNGLADVYVRDVTAGTTLRASVSTAGAQGIGTSGVPELADDGSIVAFESTSAMVIDDAGTATDIYARTLGAITSCTPPGPFTDVADTHPFCDDILWMVAEGVTAGYLDGTFRPSSGLTRMAMAAFIYRFSGSPVFPDPLTARFSDVPTSHAFFTEIEWMVDAGLTNGYANGTYRPTAAISRQALAAFLYRLAGSPAFPDPVTATFSDIGTSHVFFTEIEWLAATGIIDGYGDGTFRPTLTVTRERTAALLHGFDLAGV